MKGLQSINSWQSSGGFHPRTSAQGYLRASLVNSYFAHNRRLTGSGTGARLDYADMESSFLELAGTRVTDEPVVMERDQTKRSYLHPVAGSDAAEIGAGLFMGPVA